MQPYRLWLSIRLAHRGCCAPTQLSKPLGFAGGGKQAEGDLGGFLDDANCCSAGVRYWHKADMRSASERRPLWEVKRTLAGGAEMSASDP
jgi:hypothetical protein